jgi:Right handed beta helix region
MKPSRILQLGALSFGCGLFLVGLTRLAAFEAPATVVKLTTNSSDAQIQEALDRLPRDGEVLLGPGTYEIRHPLLLQHDGETLRGSGATTILHLADHAECPVVVVGPSLHGDLHPVREIHLGNLFIDGNRRNQSTEFWRMAGDGALINNNGVHIWNANDVTVENVTCGRCRSGGLVAANVRRLEVTGFDAFDNQFDGLACYETRESHFAQLRLHDNLAAGISLDLSFVGNFVQDAVLSTNDLGVFMRDACGNFFRGLTIVGSKSDGVFMAQAMAQTKNGWQLTPGTQCTSNTFTDLKVNGCGGRAFQVNDASCTDNVITEAHFEGNRRGGLSEPGTNLVRVRNLTEK